jgi:hypothetical protein
MTAAAVQDGAGHRWRKARASGGTNCVEVAVAPGGIVVIRDSKNPDGAVLKYTPAEWAAFVQGVREGDFDDLSSA